MIKKESGIIIFMKNFVKYYLGLYHLIGFRLVYIMSESKYHYEFGDYSLNYQKFVQVLNGKNSIIHQFDVYFNSKKLYTCYYSSTYYLEEIDEKFCGRLACVQHFNRHFLQHTRRYKINSILK